MLRVQSPLPLETEVLVTQTIGACIEVHRELGPGLLELAYRRAVSIELAARGISHDVERYVPVVFKGGIIAEQRIDIVVDSQLVLELKAVERLSRVHVAQAISYLRATGLRVALLVNFNVAALRDGVRRIVL